MTDRQTDGHVAVAKTALCYASRGYKRFKMTWTATNSHGRKQSTWLRTDHSRGCWRLVPVALRTLRSACRKPRKRMHNFLPDLRGVATVPENTLAAE